MHDLDKVIGEALDAEERELLKSIGEEPSFFSQAFGVFSGSVGWVHFLLMGIQGLVFIAGALAAWNFFQAADVLTALRWGLPAGVLLLMSLIIKMGMWPTLQTNRVIRELKRLELQMAQATRSS